MSTKKNAALLTVLMLVKKLLSILYKIPYQNVTGDAGFYVFQQVYPFIAIGMVLTSFALPTVIGGVLVHHHYSNLVKDKIKRALWIFSILVFVTLFLGSGQIALLMGDVLLAPVIRIVGIHFLFLPPIAYLRGVLQSRPETIKQFGYSIVLEQLVRVGTVLAALFVFAEHNNYVIAQYAFGLSLVAPLLTMLHLYGLAPDDTAQTFLPLKENLKLVSKSTYLMLSAGILVIFGLIDSFLVFNTLVFTETPADAMALKGVLERGLPILQAGTFFVSGLVSLTMAQMEKTKTEKGRKVAFSTGLFYILILAVPTMIGLIMVMPHLNTVLFMDDSGTVVLRMMMLQIVAYSLLVTLTAVLAKEGKQTSVQVTLLIGIFVKLVSTVPLTQGYGIMGAAISSTVSLSLMSLLLIAAVFKLFTPKLIVFSIGITLATASMYALVNWLLPHFEFLDDGTRLGHLYLLLAYTFVGMVTYGVILGSLALIFRIIGNLVLKRHRHKQRMQRIRRPVKSAAELAQDLDTYLEPDKISEEEQTYYEAPPVSQAEKWRTKEMRLDKYLKITRIIKRRQTAKEVSDAGKISVNGRVAKSSTNVSVGDEIALRYATRTVVIEVLEIKDSTKKEDAEKMYRLLREEPLT